MLRCEKKLAVVLLALAPGCGDKSGTASGIVDASSQGVDAVADVSPDLGFPPPPPIDPSTPVDMLTSAQKGALCDWEYTGSGEEYGGVLDCGDAGKEFLAIRDDCIRGLAACPNVTVAQFETCINVDFRTHGCAFVLNLPECAPIQQGDYNCPDGN
jgi:hypothetical protein